MGDTGDGEPPWAYIILCWCAFMAAILAPALIACVLIWVRL